jgi:hypothetical protein
MLVFLYIFVRFANSLKGQMKARSEFCLTRMNFVPIGLEFRL